MKLLLVLILAALVGVTAKKDQIPAYKAIVVALFILGLLASATQWRSDEEVYDESEDVAVGRVLGEIMAGELEAGCEVLVIDSAFVPGKNPRVDAHFDGLTAGWGDAGFQAVRVDPRKLVDYDPDMMSEAPFAVYEGYMETGPLLRILAQHPNAKAIVSFAGLPYNISRKALSNLPHTYLGKRGVLKVSSENLIALENIRAIAEFRDEDSPESDAVVTEGLSDAFTARYRLLKSES